MSARTDRDNEFACAGFIGGFLSALLLVVVVWVFWSGIVGFAHLACAAITHGGAAQ